MEAPSSLDLVLNLSANAQDFPRQYHAIVELITYHTAITGMDCEKARRILLQQSLLPLQPPGHDSSVYSQPGFSYVVGLVLGESSTKDISTLVPVLKTRKRRSANDKTARAILKKQNSSNNRHEVLSNLAVDQVIRLHPKRMAEWYVHN